MHGEISTGNPRFIFADRNSFPHSVRASHICLEAGCHLQNKML